MPPIHSMSRNASPTDAAGTGGPSVSWLSITPYLRLQSPKLPAGIPSKRLQAVDEGSEINYSVHRQKAAFPQVRGYICPKES